MKVSVLTTFSALSLQLHKNEQLMYKQNIIAERLLHFKTWLKIKHASMGEYSQRSPSLQQKEGKHHDMLQSLVVILTALCRCMGAGGGCARSVGKQQWLTVGGEPSMAKPA